MPLQSQGKIAANRANAKHSTGPKTAEGKSIVSQNAYKYGLRQCELFSDEDQEEYDQFAAGLFQEYDPQNPIELLAVETLVSYAWRLQRIRKLESARFAENLESARKRSFSKNPSSSEAFFWHEGKDFTMLYRYEAAMQRGFKMALVQLQAIQQARAKALKHWSSQHQTAALPPEPKPQAPSKASLAQPMELPKQANGKCRTESFILPVGAAVSESTNQAGKTKERPQTNIYDSKTMESPQHHAFPTLEPPPGRIISRVVNQSQPNVEMVIYEPPSTDPEREAFLNSMRPLIERNMF